MTDRKGEGRQIRGRDNLPGDNVGSSSSSKATMGNPPQRQNRSVERPYDIDVVLSRPWYRVGSTVVGTIRITARKDGGGVGGGGRARSIRELLGSVVLQGVGRCRLDPRWHNVQRSLRHLNEFLPTAVTSSTTSSDPSVFCFYATEPLELLGLRERTVGAWKDVRPNRPVRLPRLDGSDDDDDDDDEGSEEEEDAGGSSNHESTANGDDYESSIASNDDKGDDVVTELDPTKHLLFTFRWDLDHDDMPPTMAGSTCRFSYGIVVSVTAAPPSRIRASAWNTRVEVPVEVRTRDPDQIQDDASPRLVISRFSSTVPTLQAMAHSTGLPCAITSLELNQSGGQVTVNRHGTGMFRNVRNHLQTFRIADPSGSPVCVLTTMGMTPLSPGSRFILKFDFPIHHHDPECVEPRWVPCHQVSACLQGEEAAVKVVAGGHREAYDDNNNAAVAKQRARSTIYDVAHEYVDPDCTERVCLQLVLPPDAPCSIDSDFVVVSTWCTIDVSVGTTSTAFSKSSKDGGFQNLRLEIPIQVVHPVAAYERRDEDEDNPRRTTPAMDELMGYHIDYDKYDFRDAITFRRKDIGDELRILSLVLADRCGLKPKPPKAPAHLSGE